MRKQNQSITQDDARRMRRASLLKMAVIAVFIIVVLVFGSVAWFTMNREVEGTGVQITAAGKLFTIQPLTGENVVTGVWDNVATSWQKSHHDSMRSLVGKEQMITWAVTNSENMENVAVENKTTEELGISPGMSGELWFELIPNSKVSVTFTMQLYAYDVEYENNGVAVTEKPNSLKLIDPQSDGLTAEQSMALKQLNGHVLLYTNKDENGQYNGLISTTQDFERIAKERVFENKETVKIYWVWPETLAEVVLDSDAAEQAVNLRGRQNICNAQGRSETIAFFKSNPQYFLLNPDNPTMTYPFNAETSDNDLVKEINKYYNKYSSYYNEGDQCIGMNIHYLMLDLIATGKGVE